jgi:hypothetical protein
MYNPNAKRRRIKPYARPTSFDYNVRYDIRQYQDVKYNRVKKPFFQAASNDESFRVMEGELLVKSNNANARYNDKELHVFSFANGLEAPNNAPTGAADRNFLETTSNSSDQQRNIRKAILSTIQYMGVAVTEFHPGRDVYEQGFVATIAGLNTLYNNGAETIYPGQTVCLDLPILREASGGSKYNRALQQGVPRDKLQFILRPHNDMLDDYGDAILVNKFIVGTAISYSRPGDTVDVILHRMNYTSSSRYAGVGGGISSTDGGENLLGTFLSKTIPSGDLQKAIKGVVAFQDVKHRISNSTIVQEIDKAHGKTELDDLLKVGGNMDRYDKSLRLKLIRQEKALLTTDTNSELYKQSTGGGNTVSAVLNGIETKLNNGTPLGNDEKKLLDKDVEKIITKNKNTTNDNTLGGEILSIGIVAAVLKQLSDLSNDVEAGIMSTTANEKSALNNSQANRFTTNGGGGNIGAAISQALADRTLQFKSGSSTSTSVPKISAAVGKSGRKKK